MISDDEDVVLNYLKNLEDYDSVNELIKSLEEKKGYSKLEMLENDKRILENRLSMNKILINIEKKDINLFLDYFTGKETKINLINRINNCRLPALFHERNKLEKHLFKCNQRLMSFKNNRGCKH
ncbi:MAG: hypothetical protein LBU40_01880 [Methanobrevibacter sp.]|jgi:hypothetical protein|nr:hypothetical protein [Methanobrevibacter sp.]